MSSPMPVLRKRRLLNHGRRSFSPTPRRARPSTFFNMGLTALTLAFAMSLARLPGLLLCTESAGCDAENGAWFSCLARRFVTTNPDVRTWRAGRFFFRRTGVFLFVGGDDASGAASMPLRLDLRPSPPWPRRPAISEPPRPRRNPNRPSPPPARSLSKIVRDPISWSSSSLLAQVSS